MADHKYNAVYHSTDSSEKGGHQEIEFYGLPYSQQTTSRGKSRRQSMTAAERARRNANAKLANPLAGYSHAELKRMGNKYATDHQVGDDEDIRAFELGACLAQDPSKFDTIENLRPNELETLRKEITNRWHQPKLMYLVIVLCSVCAAVQGMGKAYCYRYSACLCLLTLLQTRALSTVASFSTCPSLASIMETSAPPGLRAPLIQRLTCVAR